MNLDELDTIATRQHGLITTEQLLALGATGDWVSSQTKLSRLHRVRKGVYRTAGVPPSQDQAWLAAVLGTPGTVLSHESAASAWKFRGFEVPDRIDLLSAGWQPRGSGVRGHQTKWLPARDLTRIRRIPITTAARTLIDASNAVDARTLGRSVDDAVRRRLLALPRLMACFDEVPWSGRRPSRNMREVLQDRVPGFDPGGSEPELDVLRVLHRAGIRPLPEQQYRVVVDGRTHRLDYAWPETKHAIEYMGALVHGNPSALHTDSSRTQRLLHAGWTIWPVTSETTRSQIIAIGVTATAPLVAT